MRSRLLVAALAALAVVSAAAAIMIVRRLEAPAPTGAPAVAAIGGPFQLVDQSGREVTEQSFSGRYMIVYFGYTYCPDVCPLGLQTIAAAVDRLPASVAARVVPVLITVDPERDTPAVLQPYVEAFHPRLVGLTGSRDEVDQVIRSYKVYARRGEPTNGGGYLVDHSTFTYLIGPDGRYVAHFGHAVTPEAMAERITAEVGATS